MVRLDVQIFFLDKNWTLYAALSLSLSLWLPHCFHFRFFSYRVTRFISILYIIQSFHLSFVPVRAFDGYIISLTESEVLILNDRRDVAKEERFPLPLPLLSSLLTPSTLFPFSLSLSSRLLSLYRWLMHSSSLNLFQTLHSKTEYHEKPVNLVTLY